MLMQMNCGKGIEGDVTAEGYQGWIEIVEGSFGNSRDIAMRTGQAAYFETTQPQVTMFTIKKPMDSASPALFAAAMAGTVPIDVQIHITNSDNKAIVQIVLGKVLIGSWSMVAVSGAADTRPIEKMTLSYTAMTFVVIPSDQNGVQGSPIAMAYDVLNAKAL